MERYTVVDDIVDYLDSNLDEDVRVDDIANNFYFNKYYLMKLFKKNVGVTMTQYVNYKKVRKSLPALLKSDDRILKIALNNGFHSSEYYSEIFTRVIGVSPKKFRKSGSNILSTLEEGGDDMTKLEQIRQELRELEALKQELLGNDPITREKPVKGKPKVMVLQSEQNKKAA